jgi:hypothetical protein
LHGLAVGAGIVELGKGRRIGVGADEESHLSVGVVAVDQDGSAVCRVSAHKWDRQGPCALMGNAVRIGETLGKPPQKLGSLWSLEDRASMQGEAAHISSSKPREGG